MKISLSILLSSLTLLSCAKKAPERGASLTHSSTSGTAIQDTAKSTHSNTDSLTYLALGDSYTVGQSVSQDQSFPFQLETRLNLQFSVKSPTVIATTGWTTAQLINAINNSDLTAKTYDFVTLLIGVNDQFTGISEDTYQAQFKDVLNTAIRFAGNKPSHVFVLSIPDYSVTPFATNYRNADEIAAIARQINEFNAINKEISLTAGTNYLDITDISRRAVTDTSLIAIDGLHPSGKMYSQWVDRLLPIVKEKLNL